jgi:pyruvoyl-dependent arginine decarboxylase (PvlArgDC)
MGLTTTLILLCKGYNVRLISSVFPEESNIFNGRKEHMSSQIAGGLILPLFYERGGSSDNKRMIKETWNLIEKLYAQTE